MKKLALTGLLVVAFLAYVIHQRSESESVNVATPATSLSSTAASSVALNSPSTTLASPIASAAVTSAGSYKDGTYDGTVADAFYGNIQVEVTIAGGKITDVKELQYPNDRPTSVQINTQAAPFLKQETIQAQSAKIDTVSGATQSSAAFRESLQAALDKAV